MSDAAVLFETYNTVDGHRVARATLNAERSLNSLTLEMVDLLRPQLAEWAEDDQVVCVILRGAGDKALCAGGDVVALHRSAVSGDDYAAEFFEREYRLDYQIHTYPKPIIVWGHGVVMGGGLGILAGASHRVVTEKTRMGMPEVTIGLYPDVGGTFFLNRTPGRTGLFLALTGAQFNGPDALFLGLADRLIAHEYFQGVVDGLLAADWQKPAGAVVSHVLREFEMRSVEQRPNSPVRDHLDVMNQLADGDDLNQIVANITGYQGDDPWLQKAAATLAAGCPTTVCLVEQQLRRGRHLSLKEAFQLELILSINCARRPNFPEGVRALLIDKDRNPRFTPASLDEVSDRWVEEHFQPPWGDAVHPLADL